MNFQPDDATKLRVLADWHDMDDAFRGRSGNEVQCDLRRIADVIENWPTTEPSRIAALTAGMTTERWMAEVEIVEVAIAALIMTQSGVFFRDPPLRIGGDVVPHAVEVDGLIYLEDGHHRVVRAALQGSTFLKVRVLRTQKIVTQEDERDG